MNTAPNKRTYMTLPMKADIVSKKGTLPMKADIVPKKGNGHAKKRKIN